MQPPVGSVWQRRLRRLFCVVFRGHRYQLRIVDDSYFGYVCAYCGNVRED